MPNGAEIKLIQHSIKFNTEIVMFLGKEETEEQIANRKRDLLSGINRMIKNLGIIKEVK